MYFNKNLSVLKLNCSEFAAILTCDCFDKYKNSVSNFFPRQKSVAITYV